MIWGLSLHGWEDAMRGSLAIVGVFGLLVGLATFFVVTLQREEIAESKSEFDKYKISAAADADAKIGVAREEAKAAASKAQADITKANAEIADAKRQTAVLEKETAQARAEQDRLKQLVIWRSIAPEKRAPLAAKLATRKETIKLMVVMNDPEAFAFASQLTTIFKAANWEAIAEAASWGNLLPENVLLPGPDNETVKLLREAFAEAGITFTTDSIRPPDASIVFEQKQTSATVVVGSKLGPFK